MDRIHRNGLAWAFLGVLLFSFSLPLTKVAVGGFDPFLTATGPRGHRGRAGRGLLLALRRVPFPPREHLTPLVFTMLGAVFGWPILLALALERTTSAHAAVIAAFMPLTTALFAVLRTHERVPRQFWIAAGARHRSRWWSSPCRAVAPRAATSSPTCSSSERS